MMKLRILKECKIDGKKYKPGDIIELEKKDAARLVNRIKKLLQEGRIILVA